MNSYSWLSLTMTQDLHEQKSCPIGPPESPFDFFLRIFWDPEIFSKFDANSKFICVDIPTFSGCMLSVHVTRPPSQAAFLPAAAAPVSWGNLFFPTVSGEIPAAEVVPFLIHLRASLYFLGFPRLKNPQKSTKWMVCNGKMIKVDDFRVPGYPYFRFPCFDR